MANVTFAKLSECYDYYNKFDTDGLFKEIGWDELIGKEGWENTCAIRMSLAMLWCNVVMHGPMAILKGPYKGKRVETSQNRMAHFLAKSPLFGAPQKFKAADFDKGSGFRDLHGKTGIVSFMKLPTYAGGHIDLLDATSVAVCKRFCHFDAKETLFWEVS